MFSCCYSLFLNANTKSFSTWCYSIDVIVPTLDLEEDPQPHYYINKFGNKIIIS